jgi:hypothetical protein
VRAQPGWCSLTRRRRTTDNGASGAAGRRWKPAEAREVLQAWRKSGLTLAEFARKQGVGAWRLQWWKQRLAEQSDEGDGPLKLVPAVVTGMPPLGSGAVLTLRARGDVVVEVADVGAVPAAWLAEFVSMLSGSTP